MSELQLKEEKFVLENGEKKIFFNCFSSRQIIDFLKLIPSIENFEMLRALYEFTAVYAKTIS